MLTKVTNHFWNKKSFRVKVTLLWSTHFIHHVPQIFIRVKCNKYGFFSIFASYTAVVGRHGLVKK